ncbi:hypothetical protein HPB52_002069 [Rhipicephalus sanguineus]|uniref:Methyltransferase type 12 domain-containing protein n=1 Tax=Rhipicephalus sanguineus TaxID=34632 RepID=A0A9D4SRA2_RHISA|nr:hypothetical protein HPB52_002069 [Rhipicephalus sanguineus]
MKFNPESYVRYSHYPSQFEDELVKTMHFRSPLTKDQQVLEIGSGTGHFARLYLLLHCQPCRRIVVTDLQPDMVEFGRERFSHDDIVYDVLDITTPDLSPFLERYGKFDRVFSFLAFQMIRDQKAAYANIAKLLNGEGECLVVAFSGFDIVDVWADVCRTPKWTGRIPKPRNVFNSLFNYNRVKSAAQVEAEVRDTLGGTGLQCISCEVRDHSWKYDSMDSLLEMFLAVLNFRAFVPTEEWTDFVDLWAELMHRKLCPEPGESLKLKFVVYVVHSRRAAECGKK